MSILVLGGAGYIGSHTVDRLVAKGYNVAVVDNLVTGHRAAVNPAARFYEGDVRDTDFMNGVFDRENVTGVIHFAAFSVVPESMQDPLKYFDNNTTGMVKLLEVMAKHQVKRIVFSSTAATYGEPQQVPIKETDPQIPTNPYGESKLAMEKIMPGPTLRTELSLWRYGILTWLVLNRMVQLAKITIQKRTSCQSFCKWQRENVTNYKFLVKIIPRRTALTFAITSTSLT